MKYWENFVRWLKENFGPETPEKRKTPQAEPVLLLEPGTAEEIQIAMTQFLDNSVPVVLFLTRKADAQIAFHALNYFTDQTKRRNGKILELYPGKVFIFFPYAKVFHRIFSDADRNLSIREVDNFALEYPFAGTHSGSD
ncbi:MAG: hypothetical protein ACK4G3_05265 [bacterium]